MSKAVTRRPNKELTGKQRSYLRSLAHHLNPMVSIGKEGVTEGVVDALGQVLRDHELVKVKILEASPISRKDAAEPLAFATGSHLVGQVGRIVIVYRMHDEKPVIVLP